MTTLEDRPREPAFGTGRPIKSTISLCPHCLGRIEAEVFERAGGVWMDKRCLDHGEFSALLASDPAQYYRYDARLEGVGSCCGPGQHCGDQVANHSCNMLIEITQRCNLACPTCYASSSPAKEETMAYDRFVALVDALLAQGKGDADLIQLSGGEPTIHPRLFDMIDVALEKGVKQVYINTNGIKLAGRAFAEKVASYGPRVSVYLQFDGFKPSTAELLRGRSSLVETKLTALAHCEALGITTVPVITLTRGVNDDELGALIALVQTYPRAVKKLMIQPAMYSGRYDNPRVVQRITAADVIAAISRQTGGLFQEADFGPIPCSDPNCFMMALALRGPDGLFPVSRYFPRYETWAEDGTVGLIAQVTDVFDSPGDLGNVIRWALESDALEALDEAALDALLDRVMEWRSTTSPGASPWDGLFAIGIKPFMDAWTYDQDRIDRCCVHIISKDGTPVSFCEYNAITRAEERA